MPNFIKDPILDPYMIQVDDSNYIVVKCIISEHGNERTEQLSFHSHLSTALRKIARIEAATTDYDSVQGYINEYERLENKLSKLTSL